VQQKESISPMDRGHRESTLTKVHSSDREVRHLFESGDSIDIRYFFHIIASFV
jgi:hypothetical protein